MKANIQGFSSQIVYATGLFTCLFILYSVGFSRFSSTSGNQDKNELDTILSILEFHKCFPFWAKVISCCFL